MPFSCGYCHRIFASEEDKWDHEVIAHICDICNQHDRDCHHRRQCFYCLREFPSRNTLREHELFGHICATCEQHDRDCECRRAVQEEMQIQDQQYPPRQPNTYQFGDINPSWFGQNGNFNPPQGGGGGWNGQENHVST